MKRWLLAFLLASTSAYAQNQVVIQSGSVTPGHPMAWTTNGVAQDAGTAQNGSLTTLGVVGPGNNICQNSGPLSGPYNQICLGATSSGTSLTGQGFGGATGNLSLVGTIALPALAGTVQCLQTTSAGVITGTGSACGSGGGGGGSPGGLNTQIQYNNAGAFGGITGVTSNGTSVTFANATVLFAGSSSGTTGINASATASGTLTLPAVTDTLTANAAAQTLTNKTLTSPALGGTITGSPTFNGNLTFSGTDNFSGVFQIGGHTQTFPASGNLVGLSDTQTLTNKSIDTSEINSGTMAQARLPLATSGQTGIVQGDGSTLTINGSGVISCTTTTSSQIGCAKPDNSTITISAGVLTAIGGAATTITVGTTTVGSGTIGRVLYHAASDLLGELTTTGSAGSVVLSTSPTLSGTVGGALTFSGNMTLGGTLTAASLATPGTIGGAICASAGGAIYYNSGSNCFGSGVTGPGSSTNNNLASFNGTSGGVIKDSGIATANVATLNTADQTLAGGSNVTSQSQSTGSIAVDCGSRPLQFITAQSSPTAWTITAPSSDGSCVVLVTNPNATATTPGFSGFSVGSNTGDAIPTAANNKYMVFVIRINSTSTYSIKALQ